MDIEKHAHVDKDVYCGDEAWAFKDVLNIKRCVQCSAAQCSAVCARAWVCVGVGGCGCVGGWVGVCYLVLALAAHSCRRRCNLSTVHTCASAG
jgi:hypothetical protein